MLLDVSGRELTSLAIPNVLAGRPTHARNDGLHCTMHPSGLDKPDRNGPSSFQDWPSDWEPAVEAPTSHAQRRRITVASEHEQEGDRTLYHAAACLRHCSSRLPRSKRRRGPSTLWALISTLGIGCSCVSALTIETPQSVVQCMSITIQWSGGIGPYFLSIHPTSGFDISNDQQFSNLSGDSMTWKANVPAGTQMVAELTDTGSGTGTNAKSQPFTVGQGPDDSCLQGPSSSASSTTTSIMNTTSTSNSSEERRPPDTTTTTSTQTTTTTSPNSSRFHSSTTAFPPSSGTSSTSDLSDAHSSSVPMSSGSPGQSPLSSSAQPGSSTSGSQDPAITADSTSSDTSSGTDTSPSSSAPVSPPSAATTDHKQTFGTAAIVGIAVGSAFALSSIILMLWWYIRRKPGPNVVSPYSDPGKDDDPHAFLPHRPQLPSIPSTKRTSTQHMLSPVTSSGRSLRGTSSASGTSGTSRTTLVSEYDALIALAGIVEPPSSPSVAASPQEPMPSPSSTVDVTRSAPSIDSRRSRRRVRVIREARYEADGGVRLAGGPLGAALEDEDIMSEARTSILPPPYHLVYGD